MKKERLISYGIGLGIGIILDRIFIKTAENFIYNTANIVLSKLEKRKM